MPMYFGNTPVSKVYLGSTEIKAAYVGSTSMFSSAPTAPTFTSVSPASAETGTTLTITGTGFSAGSLSVTIGGFAATNLTAVNDTTITCSFPGAVQRGSQTIGITTANGTVNGTITVIRPTVSSFSPTSAKAGDTITVNGFDFTAPMKIAMRDFTLNTSIYYATDVTVVSSNQIVCKIPTMVTGNYTIWAENQNNNGGAGATTSTKLSYGGGPTITSLSPTSGTVGDTIIINGSGLTPGGTTVTVGGISASIAGASTGDAICGFTVPSGLAAGSHDVVVATTSGTATATKAFTYTVSAPTFSSVSPTSGGALTSVTIYGTGFLSGTTVSIGGVGAASVNVVSTSTLTCTVPTISSAGAKDIVITTSNGSVTGTGAFTYTVSVPTYTAISPNSGKAGTSVTITGTNFIGGMSVTVGGTAVGNLFIVSPTSLTCTLPTLTTSGYKDVVLSTSSGSAIGSNAVLYYLAPTLSSVSVPQANPGVSVTVSGANFVGGSTSVTVGGVSATVNSVTSGRVRFTMPTLSGEGSKSIVVTTPGGSASTSINYYNTYAAVTTSYTTAGVGTYTIPAWCNKIDIVCVGGGGGGNGGGAGFNNGGGGGGGSYVTYTVYRGTDLAWTKTTMTYTVGAGGPGAPMAGAGTNGSPSSVANVAMSQLSAPGGTAGKGQGIQQNGYNAGDYANGSVYTFNGVTYPIGAGGAGGVGAPYVAAANGGAPGGGGGGGGGILLGTGTPGGAGGSGGVYFRAYQ